MSGPRVLCVDPDETTREATMERLGEELSDLGVVTTGAGSLADAEAALGADGAVDCLVTDYDLPDGTGLELIDRVRTLAPDASCILFTASDRGTIDTDPHRTTVAEYIEKGNPGAMGRLARLVRITVDARAQASYPLPQNERERLAALESYDFDAAELEESLRRITDLATTHFGLPTASINVIGEHTQAFLACQGAAESWGATPREDSICTFALLEDDPVTTVEDVAADPRFESNETLADLGIGAYMGADVRPGGGPAIGTLCVYAEEPRAFPEAERRYLHTLAGVAADLIEAHADPGDDEEAGDDRGDGRTGGGGDR